MVAFLRPAFLPTMLAGYFRVGEGHMWENPKLFWARACMGEIFERIERELPGFFREMDGKIASNYSQKRWKTLENKKKTVENYASLLPGFCRGLVSKWCHRFCRQWLSRLPSLF